MRKFFAAMSFVASLVLVAGPASASGEGTTHTEFLDGATTVVADEVVNLIRTMSDLIVIDSRKTSDFVAGHIQGAVNLVSTDTTAESLAEVVPSTDTPVVFYCNGLSCGRAYDGAAVAVESGYTNVYYYARGVEEWNDRGLPLVTGE